MQGKYKWLKRITLIAMVLIAVAFLGVKLFNSKKPQYNSESVKTRDIETFYTFSGNIEPDEAKTVYAFGNGKINKLYFSEGDIVTKEDDILRTQSGQKYEAPTTGNITDLYVEVDDSVKAGDPLFRVASYDRPVVVISIDEYDVSAIKKGEKVSVYVQALNTTVEGTIQKVDTEATVTGNVAYYNAEIAIEQDGSIPMGMTCEVNVPKESAYEVATISLSSVKFDEDNKPFVYLYDRYDEVMAEYVTLGVNNGTYVEILEGLHAGDTVLIPKDTTTMFMPFQNMAAQ